MKFVYSDKMSSYIIPDIGLVLYVVIYPCRYWYTLCDISTIVMDMFLCDTCLCRVLSLYQSTIVIGYYKQASKVNECLDFLKLYKPKNISTLIINMSEKVNEDDLLDVDSEIKSSSNEDEKREWERQQEVDHMEEMERQNRGKGKIR